MQKAAYDNTGNVFIFEKAPLAKWRKIARSIAQEYLRNTNASLSTIIDKYIEEWSPSDKERFKSWLRAEMETRYGGVFLKMKTAQKVENLLGAPDSSEIKKTLYKSLSLLRQKVTKLEADKIISSDSFLRINEILESLEGEVSRLTVKAIIEARVRRCIAQVKDLGVDVSELAKTEKTEEEELRETVDLLMSIVAFLERHRVEGALSRVATILQAHGIGTQELWDKIGEFAKAAKSTVSTLEELVGEISHVRGRSILRRREAIK